MRRATRDLCSNLDDSGMCIAQQNEKIRGNIKEFSDLWLELTSNLIIGIYGIRFIQQRICGNIEKPGQFDQVELNNHQAQHECQFFKFQQRNGFKLQLDYIFQAQKRTFGREKVHQT